MSVTGPDTGLRSRTLMMTRPERAGIELVERRVPAPGPGDALIRVRQASICGTDLHIVGWNEWAARRYTLPVALGHEFCGEIAALGGPAGAFHVGDRVVAETHLACGRCRQCRGGRGHTCENLQVFSKLGQGCFGDYTVAPVALLRPVPAAVPDHLACLMEPLGIAVRAVEEGLVAGAPVLVTGCGPIGLMMIAVARARGATRIIASDPAPLRRELARRLGAGRTIDPTREPVAETVRAETDGAGAGAALDASGNAGGIADALASVAAGGTLVLTGLPPQPVPLDLAGTVILREVTIKGIYGRKLDQTWLQVERLLTSGHFDLSPLLTHRFTLENHAAAFAAAAAGQAGKIIFDIAKNKA